MTVSQIINIAKISQYLCLTDIAKSGLFADGIDLTLPRKIEVIRKSVEYRYNLTPSDTTLTPTSNYLLSICYKWLNAAVIANSGGGTTQSGTVQVIQSPLPITGADFATSTQWNGHNSLNVSIQPTYNLQVFWNDINRFLTQGTEWQRTSTGINILLAGFDAVANPTYSLYIYISL